MIAKVKIVQDEKLPAVIKNVFINGEDFAPFITYMAIDMRPARLPQVTIKIDARLEMPEGLTTYLTVENNEDDEQ